MRLHSPGCLSSRHYSLESKGSRRGKCVLEACSLLEVVVQNGHMYPIETLLVITSHVPSSICQEVEVMKKIALLPSN